MLGVRGTDFCPTVVDESLKSHRRGTRVEHILWSFEAWSYVIAAIAIFCCYLYGWRCCLLLSYLLFFARFQLLFLFPPIKTFSPHMQTSPPLSPYKPPLPSPPLQLHPRVSIIQVRYYCQLLERGFRDFSPANKFCLILDCRGAGSNVMDRKVTFGSVVSSSFDLCCACLPWLSVGFGCCCKWKETQKKIDRHTILHKQKGIQYGTQYGRYVIRYMIRYCIRYMTRCCKQYTKRYTIWYNVGNSHNS